MTYLDDLKKLTFSQARSNLGNWADIIGTKVRLPELRISEALAAGPTINTTKDSVAGGTGGNSGGGAGGDDDIIGGGADDNGDKRTDVTKDTDTSTDKSAGEEDAARTRFLNAQKQIQSRLDSAKQYVQELIADAGNVKEKTQGTVKDTYSKLQNLIQEKLGQSIQSLDQTDVGIQNTYGRLAGNARRAMNSVATKNNLLAKALGNASSSWYQNLSAKSKNEGISSIYDSEAEQAAKRAAVGLQKSATTTEFNQDSVAAGKEEAALITEAESNYNKDVAAARLLERNYGIDSQAAIDKANSDLDDAYRTVDAYRAAREANATSGASYASTSAKIPTYSALSGISDTLNNNTGANKATSYAGSAGSGLAGIASNALGQYNPQNPNYFLKTPTKPKVWDELTGTYK